MYVYTNHGVAWECVINIKATGNWLWKGRLKKVIAPWSLFNLQTNHHMLNIRCFFILAGGEFCMCIRISGFMYAFFFTASECGNLIRPQFTHKNSPWVLHCWFKKRGHGGSAAELRFYSEEVLKFSQLWCTLFKGPSSRIQENCSEGWDLQHVKENCVSNSGHASKSSMNFLQTLACLQHFYSSKPHYYWVLSL